MNGKSLPRVFAWPVLGLMALIAVGLTLAAINLSLKNDLLGEPGRYVWWQNYVRLFSDERFLNALKVSALWELITVAGTMVCAILVAVFLFERCERRVRNLLCVLFIIPVLMPRVSAAFIWKFMLDPLMGVLNYPIRLGLGESIDFVGNPSLALGSVALVDIWQWSLFYAVVVLNLLSTLPKEPFEAARIDRARTWEVYAYIVLPMLKTPLIGLAFVKAIESLRSFDLIYVMTRGGPGIVTETLDMYAFSQAFMESRDVSYAAAMAVLMLLLTNIVFTLVWKWTRK